MAKARNHEDSHPGPQVLVALSGRLTPAPDAERPDEDDSGEQARTAGDSYTVQSVDRALRIVEKLAEEGEPVKLTELSEHLGLNRTTLFHLLATLVERGWVSKDTRRRYTLGSRFLEVASRYLQQLQAFDIGAYARPQMEWLWRLLDETVHLSVLSEADWRVIDVDYLESTRELRTVGTIGRPKPLYCTASGKVFLAHLPPAALEAYLRREALVAITDHTITDANRLAAELEGVRQKGYAIDDRESLEDVICIAAPIQYQDGRPAAALMVSYPAHRFKVRAVEEVAGLLQAACVRIRERLLPMAAAPGRNLGAGPNRG